MLSHAITVIQLVIVMLIGAESVTVRNNYYAGKELCSECDNVIGSKYGLESQPH